MSTAIKVENLSKAYQLGTIGTGTLSRDLERWLAKVRGKEDPFLTIGEANDRSVKGTSDVVLSLNNVSFDIQQGDAVGIIGRNGAGKSTLLKLLSRVTSPTSGSIKVKGRIASLLEVGTGFHPELTGRENIFLNGAILGMRKKEIARKFDQIVDFAGVERYIDTPVKRYSSGMYVRLAFAVAAHLESEILIVDEVLAVGDAEFQKKCLGKMNDVSKGEGRTVLFVSHNMSAIQNLCNTAIFLKFGSVKETGNVNKIVESYFEDRNHESSKTLMQILKYHDDTIKVNSFTINNSTDANIILDSSFEVEALIGIESRINSPIDFEFHVEKIDSLICSFSQLVKSECIRVDIGFHLIKVKFRLPDMVNGIYDLKFNITVPKVRYIVTTTENMSFEYINRTIDSAITNNENNWGKIIMEGTVERLNND